MQQAANPSFSIETSGLVKRYGNVVALDHVDLAVPRAAIGLLGPNGAGKSTLAAHSPRSISRHRGQRGGPRSGRRH